MTVRIHIERLVIEGLGLASGEAEVVGTAVKTELARLIADGRMAWTTTHATPRMRGAFSQSAGDGAKAVGAQIAGAILGAKH